MPFRTNISFIRKLTVREKLACLFFLKSVYKFDKETFILNERSLTLVAL